MSTEPVEEPRFRILVVCTANICRSVMAEAMLRREVEARGLPVEVGSAGVLFDGEPASADVVAVMAARGFDVGGHRSRKVTAELVDAADLVVTMERRHVREVSGLGVRSLDHVHTLGGLVGRLAGDDGVGHRGTPSERVAAAASSRRPSDLLGSGTDDVADPHGSSRRVHRRTADRLESLVTDLVEGLFGP